jgi:uncharacterized protein YvpB
MRLKDFIGTDVKYDVRALAADEELAREIQTILIELEILGPPVDGIFGPLSTAALHRFQTKTNCQEAGYLGETTAIKLLEVKPTELSVPPSLLKTIKSTVFKSKPIQSSELSDSEKQPIEEGQEFEVLAYIQVRNHFRVALRSQYFNGSAIWYVYEQHIEIYESNQKIYPVARPRTVRLDVPYKSQLDNWYNPTGSCNVTSIAMCLEYLGVTPKYGQLEDELYEYALSRGYSRHNPYDLARIVRDYQRRDLFKENAKIEEVQDWLVAGNPVVMHGYFTYFGHIVVAVGFDDAGFFVHDPYGEWFSTGYRTDLSGSYLHYSYRLIRRLCMPDGDFWVHFISK